MPEKFEGKIEERKGESIERAEHKEETAEEKVEREFQENIASIAGRAEEFVEQADVQKEKDSLLFKKIDLKPLETVLSIEEQKALDRKRTFFGSAKDKLRRFNFKLRGIEDPDRLFHLVNYLEDNIVRIKREHISVKESQAEEEIKKYKEQGYRVEQRYSSEEGKTRIIIEEDIPYEFSAKDAKRFSKLLEQPNDPIEILERLKRIGFQVNGSSLDFHLDELQSLMASRDLGDLLKKLEQIDIRGYYFFGQKIGEQDIAEAILEFAQRDAQENILTPKVQKGAALMASILEQPLDFEQIRDGAALSQDRRNSELLLYLKKNLLHGSYFDHKLILRNLRLLQEENLVGPILELARKNLGLPFLEDLTSYQTGDIEKAQKKIEDLRDFINSSELKSFLQDKDLFDFSRKASLLSGRKILLRDIDKYQNLQQFPESLALLKLFREWGLEISDYSWNSEVDDILALIGDKEKLRVIADPEFGQFIKTLREQADYKPELYDFKRHGGTIIELFNDAETKEKLLSQNGLELINYLGGFDLSGQEAYQKLLNASDILAVLKRTEEFFAYQCGKSERLDSGASYLADLASSQELQKGLFSPEAKTFFERLQKEFDFKFRPFDIKDLVELSKDQDFQAELFDRNNIEFIKKSVGYFSPKDARCLIGIEPELRPLILRLADKFDYRLAVYWGNLHDKDKLQSLLADKVLQKQLFSKRIIGLVQQIKENSYYQFDLKDIEILLKLPADFGDFLKELKDVAGYNFQIRDLDNLGKFSEHKKELFELLNALKEAGVFYNFRIEDTENLIELSSYPAEKISEKVSFISQVALDYQFSPADVKALSVLADKNCSLKDIEELNQVYQEHKAEHDSEAFDIGLIPNLIVLRENKESILNVSNSKELKPLGLDVVRLAPDLKDIADNNLLPLIKELKKFDYYFDVSHIEALCRAADHKEELISSIQEIKQHFPFFKYQIYYNSKYNPESKTTEGNWVMDPGEILVQQISPNKLFQGLYEIQDEDSRRALSRKISHKLFLSLEGKPEEAGNFYKAFQKIMHESFSEQGRIRKCRDFFLNKKLLGFIARHPEQGEELFSLSEDLPQLLSGLGNEGVQKFVLENLEKIISIPREKRSDYLEIFLKIDESPSQEIQRLKNELLEQALDTSNPIESYQKIEDIFIHNNLPVAGKAFKVFEILHSPEQIKKKLTTRSSPILNQASPRKRHYIIYNDLLKIHIKSANRSLREYVEVLLEGEDILNQAAGANIHELTEDKKEQLKYFLNKMDTLFVNSLLGKRSGEIIADTKIPLGQRYANLQKFLGVKEGQTITQRIGEMFLRPIGIERLEQVLEEMKQAKSIANQRGLEQANSSKDGCLNLEAGDLLKGVDISFISNILQNGSVAKEYLGSGASADSTPFDTDVSRVSEEDSKEGFSAALSRSLAFAHGNLLFAVKNRGQFQETSADKPKEYNYSPDQLELFLIGGNHYGIRTGFPSTEIDFMIAKDVLAQDKKELENIYYEIAQNGYYVPIVDAAGKIIFTPEMYEEYRKTFEGLERFDGPDLEFVSASAQDIHFESIRELNKDMLESQKETNYILQAIRETVSQALEQNNVYLKPERDPAILGVEFLNIGSTARGTNVPSEAPDFDFTLKLDAPDFEKAGGIAQELKEKFAFKPEDDHSHQEAGGYYQLTLDNVSAIQEEKLKQPIKIDIGFAKKSDLAVFGSHNAVEEKLDWIRDNISEEARQEVIANIILAKKVLKAGRAYSRVEHGGFGGIGVENWILANNGNILKAFESFLSAAYENGQLIPFREFKDNYKILNAGMNVKHLYHDNYTANLTEQGYQAMVKAIKGYLENF